MGREMTATRILGVHPGVRRPTAAIAAVVGIGAVLVAWGWVRDGQAYVGPMLLEIGATLLLAGPIIYLERVVTATRRELDEVRKEASGIAGTYEHLREMLPSGAARTALLEALVAGARDAAPRHGAFEATDVKKLLEVGTEGERIFALGLMQGDARLVAGDAVANAIHAPRSAFEHYHALLTAWLAWDAFAPGVQRRILDTLPRLSVGADADRSGLIAKLQHRATSP